MTPRLEVVDATGFTPWLDAAVDIYITALDRPPEVTQPRRASTREHLSEPGFRAVLVREGEELVGFAYGYHDIPGQWWHDIVAEALPLDVGLRWLSRPFQVTEIHLLPARQGRGLGTALLRSLLAGVDRDTVVLSAYDEPTRALELYRRLGFTPLLTQFRFPGNVELYQVLARDLPLED